MHKKTEEARTFEYKGKQLTIVQLMEFSVVVLGCLTSRLVAGWSAENAVSKPARAKGVNAEFSKGMVDVDISRKQAKDKADFNEYAGFAQCSRRTNAK